MYWNFIEFKQVKQMYKLNIEQDGYLIIKLKFKQDSFISILNDISVYTKNYLQNGNIDLNMYPERSYSAFPTKNNEAVNVLYVKKGEVFVSIGDLGKGAEALEFLFKKVDYSSTNLQFGDLIKGKVDNVYSSDRYTMTLNSDVAVTFDVKQLDGKNEARLYKIDEEKTKRLRNFLRS